MTPVQPEELSALIDGELDPRRAEEVEMQIAADPHLRATFEALRDLDARWRAAARSGAMAPQVRLPAPVLRMGWMWRLAVAAALVGVRVAMRMVDASAIAYALQGLVLVLVLAGVTWLGRSEMRPARAA